MRPQRSKIRNHVAESSQRLLRPTPV
jgi:hypothetical protein